MTRELKTYWEEDEIKQAWIDGTDASHKAYKESIIEYLKAQMNDQRRDFRDRCIFREILEHIGGTDETTQ